MIGQEKWFSSVLGVSSRERMALPRMTVAAATHMQVITATTLPQFHTQQTF